MATEGPHPLVSPCATLGGHCENATLRLLNRVCCNSVLISFSWFRTLQRLMHRDSPPPGEAEAEKGSPASGGPELHVGPSPSGAQSGHVHSDFGGVCRLRPPNAGGCGKQGEHVSCTSRWKLGSQFYTPEVLGFSFLVFLVTRVLSIVIPHLLCSFDHPPPGGHLSAIKLTSIPSLSMAISAHCFHLPITHYKVPLMTW